jgi:hypothetical protein
MGLSVTDRSETGLKGDVVNRHDLLGKLRDFYVNGPANPVRRSPPARHPSQAADSTVHGTVITSVGHPKVIARGTSALFSGLRSRPPSFRRATPGKRPALPNVAVPCS